MHSDSWQTSAIWSFSTSEEKTLNVPSQPHKTLLLRGQKLLVKHKENAFNTSFWFGRRATEIWKVVNLFYSTAAIFTCTSDNPITSPHYVCKHYFKFNLLVFTHSVQKELYRKQWLINPSVQDRRLSSERKISEMFNDENQSKNQMLNIWQLIGNTEGQWFLGCV